MAFNRSSSKNQAADAKIARLGVGNGICTVEGEIQEMMLLYLKKNGNMIQDHHDRKSILLCILIILIARSNDERHITISSCEHPINYIAHRNWK